jgi:hypothetical protein
LVTFCIVGFKYIKMFSKVDQIFQICYLDGIEVDWIAQRLCMKWVGNDLFGIFRNLPNHLTPQPRDDLRAIN